MTKYTKIISVLMICLIAISFVNSANGLITLFYFPANINGDTLTIYNGENASVYISGSGNPEESITINLSVDNENIFSFTKHDLEKYTPSHAEVRKITPKHYKGGVNNLKLITTGGTTGNEEVKTLTLYVIFPGCNDSVATNYNSEATEDDGSCVYDTENPVVTITSPINGQSYLVNQTSIDFSVTDNYNTAQEMTCEYSLDGGTTRNNIACDIGTISGITSSEESNTWVVYATDSSGNIGETTINFAVGNNIEILGCTDPAATNYNNLANNDDGSCLYNFSSSRGSSSDSDKSTIKSVNDLAFIPTGTYVTQMPSEEEVIYLSSSSEKGLLERIIDIILAPFRFIAELLVNLFE
ncbi:hypothetical protein ACFLZF_00130 [Nanoarchaeota archaeon]